MSRFTLDIQRGGENGSARMLASVIDRDGDKQPEPIEVTRDNLRDAAARLAGNMPGAKVADVERELLDELDEQTSNNLPDPIPLDQLVRDHPEMRPIVIESLAREGELVNVIAPSKRGKSWTVIDVVLCVVAGLCWLGKFKCRCGRVLVLDNELHRETISKRYRTVLSAKGLTLESIAADLHIVSLRGRLKDVNAIAAYLSRFKPGDYSVIVLDALYRSLPAGTDENRNSDMAALYNVLERIADQLQAVIIIVHHSSKGVQGAKSVTDTGAGAGAISRACDTHLILRDHEEKDAVVVEAAARSFPPLEPFCLRWSYPTWALASELDPQKLKRDRPPRERKPNAEAERKAAWTAETFAEKFITERARTVASITVAAKAEGISERMAKMLIEAAVEAGNAHRWEPQNPNQSVRFASIAQPLIESGENPNKNAKKRGRK